MSLARFSAEYCSRHGRLLLSNRDVGRMSVPISRLSKEDFPAEISPMNDITMIMNRLIAQSLLSVLAFQFTIHVGIRVIIGPVFEIILFFLGVFFCLLGGGVLFLVVFLFIFYNWCIFIILCFVLVCSV